MITATTGAIILLVIFYFLTSLNSYLFPIKSINTISSYWLAFTVLTGIWEVCYIRNYLNVYNYSLKLIKNKQHVWNTKYNITMLLPWNFARIFYAEYGAHADREYISLTNNWSRVVEGTHCVFCGCFALFGLITNMLNLQRLFSIFIAISMGTQLVNSLMYMDEYFIQLTDINNSNHNSNSFPSGKLLSKRPFMWINIFWTVMPIIVLTSLIF